MVKYAWPLLFCLAFLFPPGVSGGEKTLSVYTWEEYISPRAVALFEEEFDCTVEFDYYDSDDTMLQSLAEGGGYDVITPSGVDSVTLWERKKLLPLDHSLLPGLRHLVDDDSRINDREMRFSVPYASTVSGVVYNREMVPPDLVGSWGLFSDSRIQGKVAMLNDMREPLGAALRFLGHSVNTTTPRELEEAAEQLIDWKRNIATFSTDIARDRLLAGELAAIHTYNGDFTFAAREDDKYAFFLPKEGGVFSTDKFVIGADTRQPALAHAFIEFFLRPDIAAINMEDICYYMPNRPALALVEETFKNDPVFFLPRDAGDKYEVLRPLDAAVFPLYDAAWEKVLFADE